MAKQRNKYEQWLTQDGLTQIAAWARDGLTDANIAHNCGIAVSTIGEWKNKFPAISDALKKNKEIADIEIENALYKRALGYDYEEVTTIIEEYNGKQKKRITKVKKHMAPDTIAQLAWLNNRKPQSWRRNAGKEKLDEKKFEHQKDVDDKKVW